MKDYFQFLPGFFFDRTFHVMLKARQVLISGFWCKKPEFLPGPFPSSLAASLVGSHILHSLTCSIPGSSATETAGASRTLNSGQHVRQLFTKPELPIKVGQIKVIPVSGKILNMWYSFFHQTESPLGLNLCIFLSLCEFWMLSSLDILVSQFNVIPFSHLPFSLPSGTEQYLWLKSTFTNEILKR